LTDIIINTNFKKNSYKKCEEIMEKNDEIQATVKEQPWKVLIQIQLMYFISNLVGQVFALMQFYYTTVVFLPIGLFMISYLIFTVWNMFNDPLIGAYCDRTTRWTTKWGKRYPFIAIGVVGNAIALILCFWVPIADPASNPILVFIWLLIVVNVYDTFFAFYMVNSAALFQYKVRTDSDRRKSGGILMLLAAIAMMMAIILQPIVIEGLGGDSVFAYTVQAVIFAIIMVVVFLLMGKGIREGKDLKLHRDMIDARDHISFFKALRTVLTSRSYNAYTIAMVSYQITIAIAQASLSFFLVFVFGMDLTAMILPMIIMLLVAPITAPIWIKVGNKYGSKLIFTLGYIIMMAAFFANLFIQDYTSLLITMIFIGAGLGAHGVMQHPIDADVIEEAAVKTRTRNEGIYNGIQTFFFTLSVAFQVVIIGSIQLLTGLDPDPTATQTPLAILGVRLTVSVIPMIVLAIGVILFWILYDITPERRAQIQEELIELNL
jgi:Na+/melibiose symporter-like transporter